MSEKILHKTYKKLFIRNAFKLFLSSAVFNFINLFAGLFFSKAKKRTRLLMFTDKLLNRKISKCQKLHGKCEYFKNKLEASSRGNNKSDKNYMPV